MLVPSPRMAAIGRMKSPTLVFFRPPHLPRKSEALGCTAPSRSITVAAMALPMPKLRIVRFSAVADWIGKPAPAASTPKRRAKRVTYSEKLVSRMYSPKPARSRPV